MSSLLLPSKQLLNAYSLHDSYPTPANKFKLYVTILKLKPDLESLQWAVAGLKRMHHEENCTPQEYATEILYYIAYGLFELHDYARVPYYCQRLLEKKKSHQEASDLLKRVNEILHLEGGGSASGGTGKDLTTLVGRIRRKAAGYKRSSRTRLQKQRQSTGATILPSSLGNALPTRTDATTGLLSLSISAEDVSHQEGTNTTTTPTTTEHESFTATTFTSEDMTHSDSSCSDEDEESVSSRAMDSTDAAAALSEHDELNSAKGVASTSSSPTTTTLQIPTTSPVAVPSTASTPPSRSIRSKTIRRSWIFGKFSPLSSSPTSNSITPEEKERMEIRQLLEKSYQERFTETELKHYSQIFHSLCAYSQQHSTNDSGSSGGTPGSYNSTGSAPATTSPDEPTVDQHAFAVSFGCLCLDTNDTVMLPLFLYDGFCRFIDWYIHKEYFEKQTKKEKNTRKKLLGEFEGVSFTRVGLTKEQFLFIVSILVHGSTEEKLSLSFQCFNILEQDRIQKEDVINLTTAICHLLSSFNIIIGSALSVSQLTWQILSAGATPPASEYITKKHFLSNAKKYYHKLAGLGLLIPNPYLPSPKCRGVKILFGDRDWDNMIDLMVGFRIGAQMVNPAFLSSREPSLQDFETKLKFTLPKRRAQSQTTNFTLYAPHVFFRIRELCGITDTEFFYSLGLERLLGSLILCDLSSLALQPSDGRSGASFFYSSDGRFIIKQIPSRELKNFLSALPEYYSHIQSFQNSLLCRYLACAQINNSCYVIMKNIFMTDARIDLMFDLKGSTIARSSKGPVKKDNDLDFVFDLGTERSEKLKAFLTKDVKHLEQLRFTDYSLLVGVHEEDPILSEESSLDNSGAPLFDDTLGIVSRDGKRRFYLGIIDTFTRYNLSKRFEKNLKIIGTASRSDFISSQSAGDFASRFCERVIERLIK